MHVKGVRIPKFVTGTFDIIVADPPWRSDFGPTSNRATERHYPTLDLDTICALPVEKVANYDSLLFLWVTSPMLRQGLEVIEAWGFEYRSSIVWCKDKAGTGKWVRSQHEFVLLARCGRFPAPLAGTLPLSVIHAPRRAHSEKPPDLQDMIERVFPQRRYLELFARQTRPHWTAWGDEVS